MQYAGGTKTFGGSRLVGPGVVGLLLDPVAEIAVSQLLQGGVIELMVIDQSLKTIGPTIPKVPDKGAFVKELGVLLKELILQPFFERFGLAALDTRRCNEGAFVELAQGCCEELS